MIGIPGFAIGLTFSPTAPWVPSEDTKRKQARRHQKSVQRFNKQRLESRREFSSVHDWKEKQGS